MSDTSYLAMAGAFAPAWLSALRVLMLITQSGRTAGISVWLYAIAFLWTATSTSFLWMAQAHGSMLYGIALAVAWPLLLVAIVADVAKPLQRQPA